MCANAVAFSASATIHVGDSFEAGAANEGAVNKPIGHYKQVVSGSNNETTNCVWTALEGDASKLVADNSAYSGARPLWGVDTNLVLNLETEGRTLTRTVGEPKTFTSEAPIYIDTLIKFTPAEENPDVRNQPGGENVKVAVFVNAQTNLVIYHGTESGSPGTTVVSSLGALDPARWYRLTIHLGALTGVPMFMVSLNDEVISTADGYDYNGMPFGPWFLSAAGLQNTVSGVALQGTGMLDELVVTDSLLPPHGVYLAFNEALVSVTKGGSTVQSNALIITPAEIVIDAADWHQTASVTGSVYCTYSGPLGALVNVSTGTVDEVCGETVTITVAPYSGGAISTGLGGSLPADKVAAWALASTLGESDLNGAMLDDYLLNVAPGTDAKPVITSITVDEVARVAKIKIKATSAAVDFTAINGTLVVYTANTLSDSFAETANFDISVPGSDEVTIEVPLSAGKFIKAVVK